MPRGIDLIGLLTRVIPEQPPGEIDACALRHVLIVKLSSIGDVVHALPVATALKRRYPALRITWAVERWTAPLVESHPAIDRLVVFPAMMTWPTPGSGWWPEVRAAVRSLRQEQYDAALDLQGLAKSAIITRLSRAPIRLARAGQREGAHLVSAGVPLPDSPIHAVEEYLQVAAALGADAGQEDFGLSASSDARASVDRLLTAHGISHHQRIIVVNPSAAQSWKHWPASRWSEVIAGLSGAGTVVVIGTAPQAAAHRDIVVGIRPQPVDLTGRTTLGEVTALLERAALHIAPDTGTVHMAVALGTPVVAVYGPTSRVRVGPYQQSGAAVAHDDLCGRFCPAICLRSRRCLGAVTAAEVIGRARRALG